MSSENGLIKDPLWYKDAIIYELHVRAFRDSNADGMGDFKGLIEKLDYLEDLGVTALWLLPFYPSPLKDDGYDISDYFGIHPDYGTLRDFKAFVKEAHNRGIRVITELVINHTSDQHPWFQAARRAKPNSARRNFYVWSDTDTKFSETRIIFTDTETSNWAWDSEAKAYYWHRFFSHQPDLNHNNPKVVKAVSGILKFWLDMGVDGLRLDAVPYLCVQEGTNNENLPETHEVIRQLRAEVDKHFDDRMLLAEANQWPEDVRAYFGNGDECHMAFHFPVMPRIFMAIRQEDRLPITEILARTPDIPDNCQWGIFLRNHDELTLEMVTDEERDYMYREYAKDPRMRVNVGIRRRLAPLVDNNRRTIEMMNSLLFSFPGTPILYYGDEIGMGDNIYIGDRSGVRTPMQWSIDRNAGFSDGNPARLYLPVIIDPVYGYTAINVEAQQANPSSLLHFMKRIIALRRQYKAFGRGKMQFLYPQNRKILAYIRQYKNEVILCVVNLSQSIQAVELDLSNYKDWTPVEMFGRTDFPPIGDLPYFLSLGPHAFYWFKLEPQAHPIRIPESATSREINRPTLDLTYGWDSLWEPANRQMLESTVMPAYLGHHISEEVEELRIQSIKIADWCKLGANFALVFLQATYELGGTGMYCLPLRMATNDAARTLAEQIPDSILARVNLPKGDGVLYDAVFDQTACDLMMAFMEDAREYSTQAGGMVQAAVLGQDVARLRRKHGNLAEASTESEMSTVLYEDGDRLKLYRRLGIAPGRDLEMNQYLSKRGKFMQMPRLLAHLTYQAPNQETYTVGLMHDFGAAVRHTLLLETHTALKVFTDEGQPEALEIDVMMLASRKAMLGLAQLPLPEELSFDFTEYLERLRALGRLTADFHYAVSQDGRNKDFSTEPMGLPYLESLTERFTRMSQETAERLNARMRELPEADHAEANSILSYGPQILEQFQSLRELTPKVCLIRCHDNYTLDRILVRDGTLLIQDFELDPASSRNPKARSTVLRDLSSIIGSLLEAVSREFERLPLDDAERRDRMEDALFKWQCVTGSVFLNSYLEATKKAPFIPESEADLEQLLYSFMLDNAYRALSNQLYRRTDRCGIQLRYLNHVIQLKF